MTTKQLAIPALVGACMLSVSTASLAIEITDYDSGSSASGTVGGGGGLADPSFLGGQLEYTFQTPSGPGSVRLSISDGDGQTLPGEVLMIDAEAYSTGAFRHVFDGDGNSQFSPNGLGGVDLTDGGNADAMLVDVLFNDVPSTLTYTIYHSNGQTSTGVLNLPGQLLDPNTSTTLSLPFSAFSGSPDFTNVGAVVIDGTLGPGGDMIIDNLRTGTGQPNPGAPPPQNVAPFQPLPSGALVIDNFNDGDFGSGVTSAPISASGTSNGPGILGGWVLVNVDGGMIGDPGSSGDGRVGYGRSNGSFDDGEAYLLSDAISTDVEMMFSYDGNSGFGFDPAGLGSVDLTGGGANAALVLGVAFNDVPFTATIDIFSNGGADQATYQLNIPGMLLNGGTLFASFADFVGPVDFTDVSAVRMTLNSEYGQDTRLDYFAASPPALPEPASLLLTGLGWAALIGYRRRTRTA